ncbi:MAG TPA: hypothetical protein VE825_00515 [Terriglobales bacterium]|jgi:uncharacterized membrane protein|nr:hypothetical protein [Terriglobales bacterium]
MKNIYEVLRQKEQEIRRLEKEIEALRVVLPMLAEDSDAPRQREIQEPYRPPAPAPSVFPVAAAPVPAVPVMSPPSPIPPGQYSATQQGSATQSKVAEAYRPGRTWP